MKLSKLKVLSDDELSTIHNASLKILSTVGVKIESEKALEIMKNEGALVDPSTKTVKMSESLIKDALNSAPKPVDITLFNRDCKPCLKLGQGRTYAFSGFNAIYMIDPQSGVRRPATKEDVANFAKLADALENIDGVGTQAIPQDTMPLSADVHAAEVMFLNTEKHLLFCPSRVAIAKTIFDMARVVAGAEDLGKAPLLSTQASPTSPLRWEAEAIDILTETSRNRLMCELLPQPITGATSPVTLAGTLLIHNAENLSGIVMTQLANKGSPVMYGCAPTVFDMREATPIIGAPEAVLLRIASVQLAQFYNLPSHSIAPDTDSHCEDEQNAWERMITTAAPMAAGVDMIVNPGMFETGLTVSFEQLTIDNEIIGFLHRLLRGIDVSLDLLAFELIKKVGVAGHYLKERETLTYLRREHWMPTISSRSPYGRWAELASKDVIMKARERAERILREHQPRPLDAEIRRNLSEIVKKFEAGISSQSIIS